MNLKRILISESEKNRILNLHSSKKNIITEAMNDFPVCVRNAGKLETVSPGQEAFNILGQNYKGSTQMEAIVVNDPSTNYSYYWIAKPKVVILKPFDTNTKGTVQVRSYRCGCKNGKLRPISRTYDGKDLMDDKVCESQDPAKPVTPGDGTTIPNCKNKNPMDVFAEAGLNWKEERQKWIDANCNGTTPCILGNAQTNINLRNAFCDGTWGKKPGSEQNEACKTKCAAKPCQPGQICPQVQGWFFSADKVCYEATGTGGFSSKEECEACKCGTIDQSNPGGNNPGGNNPGGNNPGGNNPGGNNPGGNNPGGNNPGGEINKPNDQLRRFIPPVIEKPKPLN